MGREDGGDVPASFIYIVESKAVQTGEKYFTYLEKISLY